MSSVKFSIDAYTILGVEQDARIAEINAAYKRLALKLHPDKAGNSGAAVEQFQKIQDAVEILRDPERRALLDSKLNERNRRPRVPSNPHRQYYAPTNRYCDHHYWSVPTYDSRYRRPSRRERRREEFNWPRSHQHSTDFTYEFNSYMRSFGFSVHMDPDSADSKAKRAQFQADNAQWYREWESIDPDIQRARAELRKEKMRARMKRDVEETLKNPNGDPVFADIVDRAVNESMEELKFGFGKVFEGAFTEADAVNTCKPSDTFDQSAYEKKRTSLPSKKDGIHTDNNSSPRSTASRQSTHSDSSASDSSISGTSTSNDCHFTTQESSFEPTPDAFKTTVEAFNAAAEVFKTGSEEAEAALKQMHESWRLEQASMIPLAPYFNQKLSDPSGRYTVDDYGAEMNGVILEIYCGWLEEARLSIPCAVPVPAQRDSKQCSHLGLWQKEFCRPKCEVCDFWMPIFLLTCPSCGLKACVRCKFSVITPNL